MLQDPPDARPQRLGTSHGHTTQDAFRLALASDSACARTSPSRSSKENRIVPTDFEYPAPPVEEFGSLLSNDRSRRGSGLPAQPIDQKSRAQRRCHPDRRYSVFPPS